jgi:hypothetical protein
VINLKKSIAGQLQLDVTGVRADGAGYNKYAAHKEEEKATFNAYEVFIFFILRGSILTIAYVVIFSHRIP